jgi:hypothetical protein
MMLHVNNDVAKHLFFSYNRSMEKIEVLTLKALAEKLGREYATFRSDMHRGKAEIPSPWKLIKMGNTWMAFDSTKYDFAIVKAALEQG